MWITPILLSILPTHSVFLQPSEQTVVVANPPLATAPLDSRLEFIVKVRVVARSTVLIDDIPPFAISKRSGGDISLLVDNVSRSGRGIFWRKPNGNGNLSPGNAIKLYLGDTDISAVEKRDERIWDHLEKLGIIASERDSGSDKSSRDIILDLHFRREYMLEDSGSARSIDDILALEKPLEFSAQRDTLSEIENLLEIGYTNRK